MIYIIEKHKYAMSSKDSEEIGEPKIRIVNGSFDDLKTLLLNGRTTGEGLEEWEEFLSGLDTYSSISASLDSDGNPENDDEDGSDYGLDGYISKMDSITINIATESHLRKIVDVLQERAKDINQQLDAVKNAIIAFQ